MRLVIGGFAQGKLHYVIQKYKIKEECIYDAVLPEPTGKVEDCIVINHMHEFIREMILAGKNPEEAILQFLDGCDNCIIISNEIGNGLVPMDQIQREYRERCGRLLTRLASRAVSVERVICGIGQVIK